MDSIAEKTLAHLIRTQRVAALGTLHNGSPSVSMILYAASEDFQTFYTLISRLALHTQDLLKDTRASLMIAETDNGSQDPQQLARVSIIGQALEIPPNDSNYDHARSIHLAKFPQAAFNFTLKDFSLFRIKPESGRYVAGFGKIYDLTSEDFKRTISAGV